MYKFVVLIHVLSATIWAGGHLILSLSFLPKALKSKSVEIIEQFEKQYEKIGIPALVLQFLTGIYLAFHYMPHFSEWFAFKAPVSHMVVTKLTLLLITVGMILNAKSKISKKSGEKKLKSLSRHIIVVTVISVLFVFLGVWFKTGSY